MKVLNGTKSFPEHCAGKITLPSPNSTHFPLTHVILALAGCVRAQIEIQIAWRVASPRVKNDSDDDEDPLLN